MAKPINSADTYKHHMEKVTITLPAGLKQKAHDKGINISKVCANAVSDGVKKLGEKK